jgi:hypothetical protein
VQYVFQKFSKAVRNFDLAVAIQGNSSMNITFLLSPFRVSTYSSSFVNASSHECGKSIIYMDMDGEINYFQK